MELTSPVDLCLPDGRLNPAAIGWSRRPLHRCNLRGFAGRKKRWDYWCVTTDRSLFSITYADLDYLGLVSVYFLDFAEGRPLEANAVIPGAVGFTQPGTVGGADIHFDALGIQMSIREERGGTRLVAEVRGPLRPTLSADVFVEAPDGHETLGVVVPWSSDRFQYTSKHTARPARGRVRTKGTTYAFGPENQAFGCLDYGRGVWPYRCVWNWASASGVQRGHVIGLQLGGQWTRGTGTTENAICVDGRLHRLRDEVRFDYDRADFSAPWRIAGASGRVELTFSPFFERRSRIELALARSEVHQLFGRFDGTVTTDEGVRLPIASLVGWAEEHRARW